MFRGYLSSITVKKASEVLKDYKGILLDIACGDGILFKEIGSSNKKVFGVDMNLEQAAKAKRRGMPVSAGDIFEMPFKDKSFDAAVCLNTIYNFSSLSELKPVFNEMARIIKDNGRIVIDIRNKTNPIIWFKCWLHNRKKLFPTSPYKPGDIKAALEKVGYRLVQKNTVGIDNPYLAWGYIMVFEKRLK